MSAWPTNTLLVLFAFSALAAIPAAGQDVRTIPPGTERIISVYLDDGACMYRIHDVEDQDAMSIGQEKKVAIIGRDAVATRLHAHIRVHPSQQGVRGVASHSREAHTILPNQPIASFTTREAGAGRSEHPVRIRCCTSINPGGGCVGPSDARAPTDVNGLRPGEPRDGESGGPSADSSLMSTQLDPLGIHAPKPMPAPGGPRMIVIDM